MPEDATEVVTPLLAGIGFRRRISGIYTSELAPGVLGWIGLNRASRYHLPGECDVIPNVGVRHQEVERLVAQLCGRRFHGYIPPTNGTPLGYVLPQHRYTAWHFSRDSADTAGAEMVAAIATHGLPYMRSMESIEQLCRSLVTKAVVFEDYNAYRRAVAWYLAGQSDLSRRDLARSLDLLGDRTDAAAEMFRGFAMRFGEDLTK